MTTSDLIQKDKPLNPAEKVINDLQKDAQFADFNTMFKTTKARDKFIRSFRLSTAINPELLTADRKSLFFSLYRAAHDGLIVDNVNAALVIFNSKVGDGWVKKVQYLPMVKGIRNKIYDLCGFFIDAQVVYSNDKFIWEQGDHPKLVHIPSLDEIIGNPIAVYAIARDKSGQVVDRTVMRIAEVMAIAKKSKSGWDSKTEKLIGIWFDWFPEMCKKTAVKRLSKYLPVPDEADEEIKRILNRDIEYDNENSLGANTPKQLDVENMTTVIPLDINAHTELPLDVAGKQAEKEAPKTHIPLKSLNIDIMNLFTGKYEIIEEKDKKLYEKANKAISNNFAGYSNNDLLTLKQELESVS